MARRPGKHPQNEGSDHDMIGDYIVLGAPLGSGSFGRVWKAHYKRHPPDRLVAIKEIFMEQYTTPKMRENLKNEIAILKATDHPNIVGLHTVVQVANRLYLVMEYCAGGDLHHYIHAKRKPVTEVVARHFMRQLGAGLRVLRAKDVIHRDLKPQNILLSEKHSRAVLKIADFGLSKSLCCSLGMAETNCGTMLYAAPEILQNRRYDAKVDLWSVGAILFEMVTGRRPFGDNPAEVLQKIKSTEVRLPDHLSADCIHMCRKLLRIDPGKVFDSWGIAGCWTARRMDFEEFFAHPFMGEMSPQRHNNHLQAIEHMTFVLFPRGNQLPPRYRRATVQEVSSHRQALLKAMPGWEIANLADGSVDGARYGGHIWLHRRDDVGHKLATYA